MDRRITTRALRTQGKEKTDINQPERQIHPNEKGRLIQSCIERIKIYITIKDLYLRFWKRFFFFFSFFSPPSFIFLILYFKRKGDNLYRIGLLLFSYHPFLYQEIALIFSQSCITPRPEDWDVRVSASVRDIKILSHLEINPSVEKLHKLSAWLWSKAGVKSATSWS